MPNTFGDAHLDMVKTYPGTSVAITYGAQTGYGFDFIRGASLQGFLGDTQSVFEQTNVLVKYGDFTGLAQDTAITVDGTAYKITRVEDTDDAHIKRLYLTDGS